MEGDLFYMIYRKLDDMKSGIQSHIMSGAPKDMVEYSRSVARHQALLDVEQEIKELEKRFSSE